MSAGSGRLQLDSAHRRYSLSLWCEHASHLQRTTREHFDQNVLESTEVPAEVTLRLLRCSRCDHASFILPKELDEKVTKMNFSALGAELIVMSGEVGPTGTSPKADCGASCERFCGDAEFVVFDSGSTGNHGGPLGPVHRQNRRCDSVWQDQVRSIRTVYIQTAQKTVEVVTATEFNVPERWSRSTKCGS